MFVWQPCLIFKELQDYFPNWLYHLLLPPAVDEGSDFTTASLALVIICLFDSSHPTGCEVVSLCGFDLYSPDDCVLLTFNTFY